MLRKNVNSGESTVNHNPFASLSHLPKPLAFKEANAAFMAQGSVASPARDGVGYQAPVVPKEQAAVAGGNTRKKEPPLRDPYKDGDDGSLDLSNVLDRSDGVVIDSATRPAKRSLATVTDAEIARLEEVLLPAPPAFQRPEKDEDYLHPSYASLTYATRTEANQKNTRQQSAMMKLLSPDALSKDAIYIDFGAGKGEFCRHLQLALGKGGSFVLVDRIDFRGVNSFDNDISTDLQPGCTRERVKCDVRDLVLSEIPSVKKSGKDVVVVCKHLCGVAFDCALRSIAKSAKKMPLRALAVSPCCHFCIERSDMCGLEHLPKVLREDAELFDLAKAVTAWATLKVDSPEFTAEEREARLRKREVGTRAKWTFDSARAQFAKERISPDCELVKFTDETVENNLILWRGIPAGAAH